MSNSSTESESKSCPDAAGPALSSDFPSPPSSSSGGPGGPSLKVSPSNHTSPSHSSSTAPGSSASSPTSGSRNAGNLRVKATLSGEARLFNLSAEEQKSRLIVVDKVREVFQMEPQQMSKYKLVYIDKDGDNVTILTDQDMSEACEAYPNNLKLQVLPAQKPRSETLDDTTESSAAALSLRQRHQYSGSLSMGPRVSLLPSSQLPVIPAIGMGSRRPSANVPLAYPQTTDTISRRFSIGKPGYLSGGAGGGGTAGSSASCSSPSSSSPRTSSSSSAAAAAAASSSSSSSSSSSLSLGAITPLPPPGLGSYTVDARLRAVGTGNGSLVSDRFARPPPSDFSSGSRGRFDSGFNDPKAHPLYKSVDCKYHQAGHCPKGAANCTYFHAGEDDEIYLTRRNLGSPTGEEGGVRKSRSNTQQSERDKPDKEKNPGDASGSSSALTSASSSEPDSSSASSSPSLPSSSPTQCTDPHAPNYKPSNVDQKGVASNGFKPYKPCNYFLSGTCKKGEQCTFSHDPVAIREYNSRIPDYEFEADPLFATAAPTISLSVPVGDSRARGFSVGSRGISLVPAPGGAAGHTGSLVYAAPPYPYAGIGGGLPVPTASFGTGGGGAGGVLRRGHQASSSVGGQGNPFRLGSDRDDRRAGSRIYRSELGTPEKATNWRKDRSQDTKGDGGNTSKSNGSNNKSTSSGSSSAAAHGSKPPTISE